MTETADTMPETVLGMDTAMNACSAALVRFFDGAAGRGPDAPSVQSEAMHRGQAERLIPLVKDVMADSGRDWREISLIAVTRGPGAFTGLRIGLSSARAMAVALSVPVVGVETLSVLSAAFFQNGGAASNGLAVLIETKRTDFYVRFFAPDGAPQGQPEALERTEIISRAAPGTVFIGDALDRFVNEARDEADGATGRKTGGGDCALDQFKFIEGYDRIDPVLVCRAALARLNAAQAEGEAGISGPRALDAAPLYLRAADVSFPKNRKTVSGAERLSGA